MAGHLPPIRFPPSWQGISLQSGSLPHGRASPSNLVPSLMAGHLPPIRSPPHGRAFPFRSGSLPPGRSPYHTNLPRRLSSGRRPTSATSLALVQPRALVLRVLGDNNWSVTLLIAKANNKVPRLQQLQPVPTKRCLLPQSPKSPTLSANDPTPGPHISLPTRPSGGPAPSQRKRISTAITPTCLLTSSDSRPKHLGPQPSLTSSRPRFNSGTFARLPSGALAA